MSEAKGYDESPPRNGVIFFYTVLTVVLLVGVKFLLDSYFMHTMEGEVYDKVLSVGLEEAAARKAKDQATLEASGLSGAMQALVQRGRGASPSIAPQSGQGKAEVGGWSKLEREVGPAKAPEDSGEAGDSDTADGDTAAEVEPTTADEPAKAEGAAH